MARRITRSQAAEPEQVSSPPSTPAPAKKRQTRKGKATPEIKQEPATPKSTATKKRSRASTKEAAQDEDDLPHNLGKLPTPASEEASPPAKKPRSSKKKKTPIKPDPAEMEAVAAKAGIISPTKTSSPSSTKKKQNYRLSPGTSPYPGYARPTAEECHEVTRLLSAKHGKVSAPKTIKPPSLTTAGCGEVPSVLDALIRTRLSAATSGTNSSRAFQSLVKTFGTLQRGKGRGSVDWGAVRRASRDEVFEAIKCGGLAGNKSKDIKEILEMVWEENLERAKALKGEGGEMAGVKEEDPESKEFELQSVEDGVPNLDHLHLLSSEEAFNRLVAFPGIGPKTASCVLLFCLQRPSFAVDTHVFRLCKYLGWVPSDELAKEKGWPRVERNTTYSHCEVMVPDELKYALHQLLIRHGKECGRCRAATGMGSEGWKKGCPIEHLVKRHGAKKGGGDGGDGEEVVTKGGKRKRAKADESESEAVDMSESDEAEMSDLGSDGEQSDISEDEDDED